MSRENLLAEIKTFAPQSDAARAQELQDLVTKCAALQYPDTGSLLYDSHGRKCFEEGIRFTIQTIFGRVR